MAGNLDATYPTKTEFKEVPVDPSAASKASFKSYIARNNSVLLEAVTSLTTVLSSESLSRFAFCLELASTQLRAVTPLCQLSKDQIADLRDAAQGRLGILVAMTTLQQRPRTRQRPPRPQPSHPARLGMMGN